MPSDSAPVITLLGPTANDPTVYLATPQNAQRQPLFHVQLNWSGKPQVTLARQLPPPAPGQQLTQQVGTTTLSTLSDKATLVVHGQEFSFGHPGNIGLVRIHFDTPHGLSALGPGANLIWKSSTSGSAIELVEKNTKVKVARFSPHALSDKEPELMVYFPVQSSGDEHFMDMVVLYAMGNLVANKKGLNVGLKVFESMMGGIGS